MSIRCISADRRGDGPLLSQAAQPPARRSASAAARRKGPHTQLAVHNGRERELQFEGSLSIWNYRAGDAAPVRAILNTQFRFSIRLAKASVKRPATRHLPAADPLKFETTATAGGAIALSSAPTPRRWSATNHWRVKVRDWLGDLVCGLVFRELD